MMVMNILYVTGHAAKMLLRHGGKAKVEGTHNFLHVNPHISCLMPRFHVEFSDFVCESDLVSPPPSDELGQTSTFEVAILLNMKERTIVLNVTVLSELRVTCRMASS